MVCVRDLDQYDPYRLPPPPADKFNLPFTRPDTPLQPPGAPSQASGPEYLEVGPGDPLVTGPGGGEIIL
jgi:hypothetical protein